MKKLFVLVLFFVSFIPSVSFAYSWDTIYLQPTQDTQNRDTSQRLKSQYGVSAYYNCYPCANRDTSNPYTEATCLSQTEYCLERQEIQRETTCSIGYVYFNGSCAKSDIPDDVMEEALCLLGRNHHWDENSGDCICDSGYTKNSEGDCITYTKSCQNKFGPNTKYLKFDYTDNSRICDCKTGYEWHYNQTSCIKIKTITPSNIKGASDIGEIEGEEYSANEPNINEGAIIKTANNPDIYIVKYVGTKKFKRLILSPSVFNNYSHLKWEDVVEVSQSTIDSFITSELVRAVGDDKIYRLYPQGDLGQKRLIKNNSVLTRLGFDSDSIYEINLFDRESYLKGLDLE